jgi:hypothetical protein
MKYYLPLLEKLPIHPNSPWHATYGIFEKPAVNLPLLGVSHQELQLPG